MRIISKEPLPHGMPNDLFSKLEAWHVWAQAHVSGNFPLPSYFSTHDVSDEVLRGSSVLPEGMSAWNSPYWHGSCERTRTEF